MPLQDVNHDETRLRPTRLGLGGAPGGNGWDLNAEAGGGLYQEPTPTTSPVEYTPYEVVSDAPAPGPTLYTAAAQPALPVFNPATGTSACVDCTTGASVPAAAYQSSAASAVPSIVTPLPPAPKPVNWLLLAAAGTLAFVLLSGRGPGLGNAPEPAPAPRPAALGRPPRKTPAKPKHLESLTVS